MKKINVLHLASFNGNVGDNANHNGFYGLMESLGNYVFEYTPLEIREFYWKRRLFDASFVEHVNVFDLLVIGGGNYFELWVDHSPTGTSIMIEPELFEKIKIPVLFNALGVDPGQGVTRQACEKFRYFLDVVLADSKNMVSVRNDGALDSVRRYIGDKYLERISWTPDAGVLVSCDEDCPWTSRSYLAVNLAGDMLDVRFPNSKEISYSEFIGQISEILLNLLRDGFVDEVVLIPHIYKDLECINDLLRCFPDEIVRMKIVIAPLLHGMGAEKKIFSIYKNAKITFAMRFHANLCSIGLGTPTIGLNSYIQIQQLYAELGLSDCCVCVNRNSMGGSLMDVLNGMRQDMDGCRRRFYGVAVKQRGHCVQYIRHVGRWLDRQNFPMRKV